jgi:hypothetical protein
MAKITSLSVTSALLGCGLSVAPAQAEPNRTWVSGKGTDSGACTLALPCRTLAFALTQTHAGGEIDVLDPADYGTVTITKAINILNDGVGTASILNAVSDGNGVTIIAGASDSVHLRGLTIEGLGRGNNGILFNTGGNLEIENCVIRGFTFAGINIAPSTSTPSSFSVSKTIASNNGRGIVFVPIGSAVVTGSLGKVTTNNNFNGILVDGSRTTGTSLNVTIVNSEASGNINYGVRANSASGHAATAVMLRNSVASNNGIGLVVNNNAILRVGHSVVRGSSVGVAVGTGGVLNGYSDNDIDGNTNNNTSVLVTIPTH